MSNNTVNLTADLYNFSTTAVSPPGPPLWYQYPECAVAPYGYVFYFTGKMFNLAVGTPCNILVIWQITTRRSDFSTSDIFFLNLAFLDTYFCLMGPVDMVNRLLLSSGRLWYFQRFAYGVKDLAPLFLVCICLDRYVAVVHPVLFAQVRNNKIRIGVSVLVWGIILSYGIGKSFLGSLGVHEIFSGIILSAFAIMVFCNISIIWVLRRSVLRKEEMHPVKKKAFKMVMIILTIIVANYLPPVALMPFSSYYSFVVYNCQVTTSVFCIMDLSSSIEPLLYISKMERFEVKCCQASVATSR